LKRIMNKPTVIFIVGPTSSGKTEVALDLARKLNGEIISCDSMQIYRDMDIITRVTAAERMKDVPAYLARCVSPEEEYNAARFAEEAEKAIEDILSRDGIPVVAGGTGLYMKALLDGIFSAPPKDEEIREELKREAEERGGAYLHKRLEQVDPETAAGLHPNDVKRIIRALEIYELTGETIHDKKKETAGIGDKYECRIFGLELERGSLYGRINGTVDRMFDEGLVEEVRGLRKKGLSRTAGKALGIKEVGFYLEGAAGLDKAREELKKNTRRYAKRQLTWFRADKRVKWINVDRDVAEIVEDILRYVNE